MNPENALTQTLDQAASFLTRHRKEEGVGPTYGYFTTHPVAPLNRKRLGVILAQLQQLSVRQGRALRVLDLACGGGIITSAIGALGHRVLGLDLSPREIELARLFASEEKTSALFDTADLLDDPSWESRVEATLGGKPDVIVLAYALHHLPRVEEFAARVGRWLPEGAALIVNEENPEAPLFRLKHRVRTWIQKDTETEWHRSYEGWRKVLEPAGFRVSSPLGMDLLPIWGRIFPLQAWSLVFVATRS